MSLDHAPIQCPEIQYRTYKVSSPLIALYYTQLIGDARNPPTILAASSFSGMAVIGMQLIYRHDKPLNATQTQIRTFQTVAVHNIMVHPLQARGN